ncbi:MAG: hypothetical protein Q9162_006270 [Coniocarpon cinnabarinum]
MSKAAKKKWIKEQKVADLQLQFDRMTLQVVYPSWHIKFPWQARRDLKDFERLVRKYRKDGTTVQELRRECLKEYPDIAKDKKYKKYMKANPLADDSAEGSP